MGLGAFRFFLAFLVAISHLWDKMIGGPAAYAVWGFYLISGYLMAYVLNYHYGFRRAGIFEFYKNRTIRIYPGYFIAVLFGIVSYKISLLNGISLDALNPEFGRPDSIKSLLFNFTLIPIFQTSKLFVPVSQALGLEVGFYLLVPFIAIDKRCTILALIITAGINLNLNIIPTTFALRYSSYYTALFAFSMGIALFHYKQHLIRFANLKLAILLWVFQFYLIEEWNMMPWGYGLYASLLFTAYVLLSCCDKKANQLDSVLGDMSYIVYLMHTTFGYILLAVWPELPIKSLNFFIATFFITCGVSYVITIYFERPIQRYLKGASTNVR